MKNLVFLEWLGHMPKCPNFQGWSWDREAKKDDHSQYTNTRQKMASIYMKKYLRV